MKKLLVLAVLMLISTGANAIELEVNKGQIINLSRPAAHIFIADPDIADIDVRSPNYIYVYGLKVGETSIHALDVDHKEIMHEDIIVKHNTARLKSLFKELMPDANISFTSTGGGLILKGSVNTPEDAEKALSLANSVVQTGTQLVNMLKVKGSDQVMLKVRVAEVARSELKNFGINLSDILTKGSFSFSLFTGRNFTSSTGAFIRDGNNINIGGGSNVNSITGVIDALETEGLVKILAEPNLTAKSGEAASFLAGGEYPIPVPQENGVTSIEYREFGVKLDFTPTVLSDERISLQVAPEVSNLTSSSVQINNNNIPTLSTRRVSTTVELGSGESFAIAGLMKSDSSNDVNKFPWLGDVPVLGALFSSNDFQKNETELVVIVTPYIVRGVKNPEKLVAPTDGMEVPNDFERILLGKMEVQKPAGSKKGVQPPLAKYKLHGDAGYQLGE